MFHLATFPSIIIAKIFNDLFKKKTDGKWPFSLIISGQGPDNVLILLELHFNTKFYYNR